MDGKRTFGLLALGMIFVSILSFGLVSGFDEGDNFAGLGSDEDFENFEDRALPALPDLVTEDLNLVISRRNVSGLVRYDLRINWKYKNIGTAPAFLQSSSVEIFRPDGTSMGSSGFVGKIFGEGLAPGEYLEHSHGSSLPGHHFSQRGMYRLVVTADPSDSIEELDETNNVAELEFRI